MRPLHTVFLYCVVHSVSKHCRFDACAIVQRHQSESNGRTNWRTDDKAVLFIRFVAPGNLILFKYTNFAGIVRTSSVSVAEHERIAYVTCSHIWGGIVNRRSVDNFLINRNESLLLNVWCNIMTHIFGENSWLVASSRLVTMCSLRTAWMTQNFENVTISIFWCSCSNAIGPTNSFSRINYFLLLLLLYVSMLDQCAFGRSDALERCKFRFLYSKICIFNSFRFSFDRFTRNGIRSRNGGGSCCQFHCTCMSRWSISILRLLTQLTSASTTQRLDVGWMRRWFRIRLQVSIPHRVTVFRLNRRWYVFICCCIIQWCETAWICFHDDGHLFIVKIKIKTCKCIHVRSIFFYKYFYLLFGHYITIRAEVLPRCSTRMRTDFALFFSLRQGNEMCASRSSAHSSITDYFIECSSSIRWNWSKSSINACKCQVQPGNAPYNDIIYETKPNQRWRSGALKCTPTEAYIRIHTNI